MGLQDGILRDISEGPSYLVAEKPARSVEDVTIYDLAENAVLAGCCRNADYTTDALKRLVAADFDLEWRQTVWQAMVRLSERGERVNSGALYPLLSSALWDRLTEATAEARNPHEMDYVRMVKGYARLRAATAGMLKGVEQADAIP